MTSPVLTIEGLQVGFGGPPVIRDVDLEVDDDEIVALIGPNGAGKTVLLNAVCGIYKASHGTVRLHQQELVGRRPEETARFGIGRAFQHAELFGGLTVLENIQVPLTTSAPSSILRPGAWVTYRSSELVARRRAEEVIEHFELEAYRHERVNNLSFGIQKLVGVARATTARPQLLLLDEPSSGLSRQEKEDFARFLLRLRHDLHIPVLWIEHDMQLVMDLADRIVVLNHGVVIARGRPDEISRDAGVIEAYLGVTS